MIAAPNILDRNGCGAIAMILLAVCARMYLSASIICFTQRFWGQPAVLPGMGAFTNFCLVPTISERQRNFACRTIDSNVAPVPA